MFTSISNFINDKNIKNGLLLIDPNTGSGKSYQSCQAIYSYVHSPNSKPVYYSTSLIKNLPIDEMGKTYGKHGNPNYDSEVLVIKSNVNFVKDNLPNTKVPLEYQQKEYKNLKKLLEIIKEKSFKNSPIMYQQEIEERIASDEYAFRSYLRKIIASELKGSAEEKKNIIKCNRKYQWIGQIYPTVFTDDYKIIFLSVNKLLTRNDTLIRPSYQFISADVLRNSIFFIDEFDATKETIIASLIKEAVDAQNDYLDIVKELHGKLHDYKPAINFYKPYADYAKDKDYLPTLESMTKEVDGIFDKYALYFNYKTDSNSIDRSRGFLFFDGAFRSYLKNNCHYIRTHIDENEQQVKIYFESKEDYDQNKDLETDINIYSLLREFTTFLNSFARFIASWAEKYAEHENQKRKKQADESGNHIYESFTFESALNTICGIYFKNERLNTILHDLAISTKLKNVPAKELNTNIDDFSFYNRGYKFFEFLDSDLHNEETKIQFVQINNTPEKILLFMSKNSKVIGLSATSRINSVLSNYSLDYLKEELNGNLFYLSDESYESIKTEQNKKWRAYRNGTINVIVDSVDKDIENKSISERLAKIVDNKDLQTVWENQLKLFPLSKNNSDYYKRRYCNIFEVLKRFIENDEIKSFLCLNMALPKPENATMNLDVFTKFVEQYCNIYQKDIPEIRVLNSDDFDTQKDKLLGRISSFN